MGRKKVEESSKKSFITATRDSAVEIIPCGEIIEGKRFKELSDEEKLQIREKCGLNYKLLCERIVDGLNAFVCNAETGKPICPANSERVKWIEPAMKMVGAVKNDGSGDINFNLTVGERSEIKTRILRAVKGNVGVGVLVNT